MSAGCIPKKADRIAVVSHAIHHLQAALKLLRKCLNPDQCPRDIEEASALIAQALGHHDDDGTDHHAAGEAKTPGLRRLTEHYFS